MPGRLVATATWVSGLAADSVARLANRFWTAVGTNLATLPKVLVLGLGLLGGVRLLAGADVTQPKNGSGSWPGSSTALTAPLPPLFGHFELMCPGFPQE